jgi:hypothetical protein
VLLRRFAPTLHATASRLACALVRIVCAGLLLGSTAARSETSGEFWPEFNAFLKLNERTRAFLLATTSRLDADAHPAETRGDPTDGTFGVHLDYSLMPVFRPKLREQDWARNRYLWTRVGYQYSRSFGDSDAGNSFRENRGIFEMTARTPPLAGSLEWIARVRWDLRRRDVETFSVYRLRLGVERQFDVRGHATTPYLSAEAHYDTRYNEWKQMRYQAGAEVVIDGPWRIEPYLEVRHDRISEPALIRAVGLVFKYYL